MLIFDIECDGFYDTVTKIHTISIYDKITNEYFTFDKENVEQGVKKLQNETVAGHNIIAFDIPIIKKLYPWFKPLKAYDTLVMTRLAFSDISLDDMKLLKSKKLEPKLLGSHSLKAWGQRLGIFKGNFGELNDWSEWSQEMSDYCLQDVKVTKALIEHLLNNKDRLDPQAFNLEFKVQEIISRQMLNGFLFDKQKAELLQAKLLQRANELEAEFKKICKPWKKVKDVFTPKKDNAKLGYKAGESITRYIVEDFKPTSTQHITHQLQELYGFKPLVYTEKKQIKMDGDILESLDYPLAKMLTEYLLLDKRLQQLSRAKQSWLKNVCPDDRIRGSVNSNGTVTGRMTHSKPNMAQVPAVYSPYGKECRELFKAKDGYSLVGCDASSLELRTLSHYLSLFDGGAYGKEVVKGDIHTANQKAAGLDSRDKAKKFIYSWLYGGGDLLIGLTINNKKEDVLKHKTNHPQKYAELRAKFLKSAVKIEDKYFVSTSQGEMRALSTELICYALDGYLIKQRFLKNLPALTKLREAVSKKAKENKHLIGLDKRVLPVRSAHSALNLLLQSAGAIVMKQYLVCLDKNLQKEFIAGVDYEFVANIHDEVQIEVKDEIALRVKQICEDSFAEVTKILRFRVPLSGEAKIGKNWSLTH